MTQQQLSRTAKSLAVGFSTVFLAAMAALSGCDNGPSPNTLPSTPQGSSLPPQQQKPAGSDVLELVFPYGSEKQEWIDAVTADFNRSETRTDAKNRIWVRTIPLGSGELISAIQEGRIQAHLASPASSIFIEMGNAESKAKSGKPLIGETRNLVLSPVVIAMWKPMAEALGWGKRPLGWADILAIAGEKKGWAGRGFPQWGDFKFGHTHPEYSNSGIISVFAEVYAGAGLQASQGQALDVLGAPPDRRLVGNKVKGLTIADVNRPEVGRFLQDIEKSVVHYGSSTGFFGKKMFAGGPQYLSAAVLYENMVIESYNSHPPAPIVAIYPKEGTFWSDHPVGIVDREWVDAEHRQAAEKYIAFLTAAPQQKRALEFGFRPADVAIPLAAPIDAAHGVDPQQPETTLETPSAPVMASILELWKAKKKHANVVLAIDVSGSMNQEGKIGGAKLGAKEMIDLLGKDDTLSLMSFNHRVAWAGKGLSMATDRERAKQIVDGYFADGETALYDAIDEAYHHLTDHPDPDTISAIVVLSDGDDNKSRIRLENLLQQIAPNAETHGVRVFTIGYGRDAMPDILGRIAETTQAKYYSGKPENIREVFKEISTFF